MRWFFSFWVLVFLTLPGSARAEPPTVAVFGQGSASAAPDQARFRLSVTAQQPTASAALADASARAQAVLDTLSRAKVASGDVQTGQVNVHPLYERVKPPQNTPPRIVGHRATISVTVRVRDLDRLGAILDAVTAAGGGGISGLNFSHSDPSGLRDQARQAAMTDAARAAGVLAKAATRGVGTVVSISDESVGANRPPLMMAMRTESAGVPVAAGEISVAVRVRVVYQLTAP